MAKSTLRFTATIEIIGINPHVIVPDVVVAALLAAAGKKALPVPVAAILTRGLQIRHGLYRALQSRTEARS